MKKLCATLALGAIIALFASCDTKGGDRSGASGVTQGNPIDSGAVATTTVPDTTPVVMPSPLFMYQEQVYSALNMADSSTAAMRDQAVYFFEDPQGQAIPMQYAIDRWKANLRAAMARVP